MGRMMRRHWLPACLSEEVADRDGPPVRVRLLGEDLVAFRDSDGRLGVVGELCPHRRASLALGRNEECGLRCLYHGWKIDVAGNILEMPSEPADSRFREKLTHKAYPVHEAAGLLWVFMGPAEEMPPFDPPVFQPAPDTKISIARIIVDCNWAQVLEGAIDSAHSSSLHSSDMLGVAVEEAQATDSTWERPSKDKAPRLVAQLCNWGFRYAAIRKPLYNEETHHYVRTTLFVAPFYVLIPPNATYKLAQALVPVDDETCWFNFIAWHETKGITTEAWRKFCYAERGPDLEEDWTPKRRRENDYLQDRQAMSAGNWTGIDGIPSQDMAMWETMGPIAHRWDEKLGVSDLAIVQFRRQMVAAVKAYKDGQPAIGTVQPRVPFVNLSSFEGVVPKTVDWRTLGVDAVELAMERHAAE
jgi:phthalate 4,5-dioxygenase oxygenase subunit